MKFDVNDKLLDNEKIQKLLSNCPFHILNQFEIERYHLINTFLFQQNHYYDNTFILLDGTVEIFLESTTGKKIAIDTYSDSGLFIGEQEALLHVPYSSSVRNTNPVSVLKLSNQAFLNWLETDHSLTQHLLKNQCAQVYHLTHRTEQYTLYNIKEQVAITILHLYKNKVPITKTEIINSVAASPRHINRILVDLENKKIINLGHSLIEVNNVDQLAFYGESL